MDSYYSKEELILRMYDTGYGAVESYDCVSLIGGGSKHISANAFGGDTLEELAFNGLRYYLNYPFA